MRKALLAAAVAVALVLGACGDDDSADDAGNDNPPSQSVDAGGDRNGGGGGGGGGSGEPFCGADDEFDDYFSGFVSVMGGVANPADAERAVERLYEQLGDIDEVFDRVADRAPREIEDDVRTVLDAVAGAFQDLPDRDEVVDAVRSGDQEALAELFAGLGEAFELVENDPELKAASDRVEAWVGEHCPDND